MSSSVDLDPRAEGLMGSEPGSWAEWRWFLMSE